MEQSHDAGPYPFRDHAVNSAWRWQAGRWIEVRLPSSADAGEMLAMLDDPTVAGAWEDQKTTRLYWSRENWKPETLDQLQQAVRRLTGHSDSVTIETLDDRDWNALWAQSVRPLKVGKRIWIRPSWECVAREPNDIEIILDPKQAFGTGHHATTRLLIERLEEIVHGGERVLDIGTGSGILAMVALRLGAASVLGLDTDPVAIQCARDYAVLNGFGPELQLRVGTCETEEEMPFDLILANLDRPTLLTLAGKFRNSLADEGRLLLSGLLVDDREEIVGACRIAGGVLQHERQHEGWIALEVMYPTDRVRT